MDTNTGEILQFENDEALAAEMAKRAKTPDGNTLVALRGNPDPDCRKCYGRGHIGKNTLTGQFVPCRCCN